MCLVNVVFVEKRQPCPASIIFLYNKLIVSIIGVESSDDIKYDWFTMVINLIMCEFNSFLDLTKLPNRKIK